MKMFPAIPGRYTVLTASILLFVENGVAKDSSNTDDHGADTAHVAPVVHNAALPRGSDNVPVIYQQAFLGGSDFYKDPGIRALLPFKRISLKRTGCPGGCAAYNFVIFNDGTAKLEALSGMPKKGMFSGTIDMNTYARLCFALEQLGYLKLENNYVSEATDLPGCIVSVETKAGEKSVTDYGSVGPIQLWVIQEMLDGVRLRITWQSAMSESGSQ
jgi:hypothetical protein